MSASWLLVSTNFHLDHWVKIDPVEHPIECGSVGAGTVSHCRAPPFFIIILISASLSSKVYNKALWQESLTERRNQSLSNNFLLT